MPTKTSSMVVWKSDLDSSVASIAIQSVTGRPGWLLRAVCSFCENDITWAGPSWMCSQCEINFSNLRGEYVANYWSPDEKTTSSGSRYSMKHWVASWILVPEENVTVLVEYFG